MIFFLHGPDTYRARQKLAEIREKYEKTYLHAVHVQDFDCAEIALPDLINAFGIIAMFERKKLLIFRNVFGKSAFEDFFFARRKQLAHREHHIVVLFEAGETKAKAAGKLYQWLKKNATHQEFLPLSPAELKRWIAKEFSRYNLKATLRAQEELARAVGNNLWQLSQEIKKIAAWKGAGADTKQVKDSDVALFLRPPGGIDVFAMLQAVAQKNKKQALGLLYGHLQKGDSPAYLFSMFVYQFRTILQIRDMGERKLPLGTMLQKTQLHPYALKKGLQVAQNFSFAELKAIYEKLFILDKNLKTGKGEAVGHLDLLIATL